MGPKKAPAWGAPVPFSDLMCALRGVLGCVGSLCRLGPFLCRFRAADPDIAHDG